jgi:cardiolipin synthase
MSATPRIWRALNWPNRISLLRLLLVPPFIVLLLNQREIEGARYAALGVFVVMGVSDAIDGLLARRLRQRSRLGAILDPLADKVLIVCAVILLALETSAVPGHEVPNWVVVAVVGKDLWVVLGFLVVYLSTERMRVSPTVFGKMSTFGQIVMVSTVLLAPDLDRIGYNVGGILATIVEIAVVGLCVLAVVSYTRKGLHYMTEEGKPLDEHPQRPAKRENGSD